ncbi:TPA: NUMOD4 domain-containing protein [Yersinia enterocolitica]
MSEIWKPIPNYEHLYEVSSKGVVRSLDRICLHKNGVITKRVGVRLKTALRAGYPFVLLQKECKIFQVHVHRLVAEAFCIKPNGCNIVNHIDSDRTNNDSENLEWTTHLGNMQHATINGRWNPRKGSNHPLSILKECDVEDIKRSIISGASTGDLAIKFNVDKNTISSIKYGRRWKDVLPELSNDCSTIKPDYSSKGSSHHNAKINEEIAIEIIKRLSTGESQKSIATSFNVNPVTISNINNGIAWRHVRVVGCGEPPYFRKSSKRKNKII